MSDAADRIEAIVDGAANSAAAIVEGEALDAASAIERAEERVEAAEEAAEDLAAAALMTRVGALASEAMEGVTECRNHLSQLETNLTERLQAMSDKLESLTPTPAVLSIPQPSEGDTLATPLVAAQETVVEALEAVTADPNATAQSVVVAVPVAPQPKQSRWI